MRSPKEQIVFIDFDNTISAYDVIDDMLARFSVNDDWKLLEEQWKSHKIGSEKCLAGQMKGIRISKEALDSYLSTVELDGYFGKLVKLFKAKNIKMTILSDNFRYILKAILKHNGFRNMNIYSNRLTAKGNKLIPSFPFSNRKCRTCAHCKRKNMRANIDNPHPVVYYIGDGMSDICPSKYADIIFAKDHLRDHLKKEGTPHIPIKGLKDVYRYFERVAS